MSVTEPISGVSVELTVDELHFLAVHSDPILLDAIGFGIADEVADVEAGEASFLTRDADDDVMAGLHSLCAGVLGAGSRARVRVHHGVTQRVVHLAAAEDWVMHWERTQDGDVRFRVTSGRDMVDVIAAFSHLQGGLAIETSDETIPLDSLCGVLVDEPLGVGSEAFREATARGRWTIVSTAVADSDESVRVGAVAYLDADEFGSWIVFGDLEATEATGEALVQPADAVLAVAAIRELIAGSSLAPKLITGPREP